MAEKKDALNVEPRGVPWGLAGVTEEEMLDGAPNGKRYASGKWLRQWRGSLDIGQKMLAEELNVTKGRISQIETDDYIPESMRWKLWHFIFKEADEHSKRIAEENKAYSGESAREYFEKLGLFKPEHQRIIEGLSEQLHIANMKIANLQEAHDHLRNMLNFNLYDLCLLLKSENEKLKETVKDYEKLFNLRGAAVAGDELQEQIEAKLKDKK